MTTSKVAKKPSPNRGAKILIASLSVAATLSGWAVITYAAPAVSDELIEFEVEATPQTLNTFGAVRVAPLPKSSLPRLADLPLRGLREVGSAPAAAPSQPQAPVQQPQQQAPRERNANSNAPAVSQPAPPPRQQEPKPKPEPVRKTKSSR